MTLFILTETAAGYALLKAKDKKLLKRDDLAEQWETAEGTCGLLKLKQFRKFESASSALEEAAALTEGKVTPLLSNLLSDLKEEKKLTLAVADPKLGNAITKLPGLSITPISDSSTSDLFRSIRSHLTSLIPGLLPEEVSTMSLGLSHSLSRHKLKFSPDKVDTMIIQAIALLDDLDKELNTYAMRVKEWYGWHFPEMARIINDNLAYARVILAAGMRGNYSTVDLTDILPEEIETAVKAAAEVSMGTEITEEDLENIQALAEQVVGFTEYRAQLSSYLSARMQAIAPNLTALVGELVGARLIAHAGSLMNLAKSPASTVQILGAEKALFRALKTKHDTPKYGLLYHASLIGQATGRNKGKIARMLATKATLGLRVDALSDWGAMGEGDARAEPSEEEKRAVGVNARADLERRLRVLEGRPLRVGGAGGEGVGIGPQGQKVGLGVGVGRFDVKEARKYNPDADGVDPDAGVNGDVGSSGGGKGKKRKLVEEVDAAAPSSSSAVKKAAKKEIVAAPDPSSSSDDDDDDNMDEIKKVEHTANEGDGKFLQRTSVNGTSAAAGLEDGLELAKPAQTKEERKAEKARRKAERKAEKAERRSEKGGEGKSGKKRKVEDGEGEGEKKKRKKTKS